MEEDLDAVLAANDAFYKAFNTQDFEAMRHLWSDEVPIACIHPGWDALHGSEYVIESWRQILANPASPQVSVSNETPYVYGGLAFVICHEVLEEGILAVTNIFARSDEGWRMVHHQASPLAAIPPPEDEERPPPERLH